MKDVFTTGEAAKICRISQQSIIRCFDSGLLKGFKVPGSKFRRIPRKELRTFMMNNGIPMENDMLTMMITVIVVTQDQDIEKILQRNLTEAAGFALTIYDNTFDAGVSMSEVTPDAIIMDCGDMTDAENMQRSLQKKPALSKCALFALTNGSAKTLDGVESFRKPFDADLLAERIKRNTGKGKA